MKKILGLLFVLGTMFAFVRAQDVIVLKNTDEIQVKVLEVASGTVRYVEWDFQDGPTRVINTSDIFVIKYQNGKKESFEENAPVKKSTERGRYINKIKTQAYLYFGTPIEKAGAGPAVDASIGARFYDYFYLGLELGYACVFEKMTFTSVNQIENFWMYTHMLSVDVAMKGYLPVSTKFSPFMDLSLGVGVFPLDGMIHDKQNRSAYDIYVGNSMAWFDMKLGVGIDYGRFSMGIGYHLLSKNGINADLGYFRVGVRL